MWRKKTSRSREVKNMEKDQNIELRSKYGEKIKIWK